MEDGPSERAIEAWEASKPCDAEGIPILMMMVFCVYLSHEIALLIDCKVVLSL